MTELVNGSVWVFGEVAEGHLAHVVFELLSKGRSLADQRKTDLVGVLVGQNCEQLADEMFLYGADKVLLVNHNLLKDYQPDPYTAVIEYLVNRYHPEIFLFGATRIGLGLAPSVAARLQTGLSAHVIELDINEHGRLEQIVPAFGLSCAATILCPERNPQIATVKPGSFSAVPCSRENHELIHVQVEQTLLASRTRLLKQGRSSEHRNDNLDTAEIVVGGGGGIGSLEGWELLIQFAEAAGAAVGASRPAVDEGWAGLHQMIGHSGRSIKPKVYVSVGVSGDMLHMVGIQDANLLVAINQDPHAPIFQQVDIGVVSDYREFIPLLIQELKGSTS